MGKIVAASKFAEWKGLDRIQAAVHDMHCIFRELTKDDFGIDGEIEVVVPKEDRESYEVTGGIIKLQSKSGDSYIKQDSETTFSIYVRKQDLELWNASTYPVVLVVYHPGDDQLYWKDVKTYIKTTPLVFQPPLRITFHKAQDIFDDRCYEPLCMLANTSPPPISFQQQELLYSNLLPIKRAPKLVTRANTPYQRHGQIRLQLEDIAPPFTVREGALYTLADLRDPSCVLRPFCDLATLRDVPIQEWIADEQAQNDYIFLLNQLLTHHLHQCGLRYNKKYHRSYFPRENNHQFEFKRSWFNVRTNKSAPPRIVAKRYRYGKETYWRHLAAQFTFQCLGNSLYLQILPQYLFTIDGSTPCDPEKVGAYTTKIKARERNIHVLNHILFWVDVLSQRTRSIELQFASKTVLAIDKTPFSGVAPFAILNDPAVYDETEEYQQSSMFDFAEGEETDDFYL